MKKLKNIFLKTFFFIFTFIIICFLFAKNALAQDATSSASPGPWYNQSFSEWHAKVYGDSNPQEIFGERYTAAQVQWVMYGLFSFLLHGGNEENAQIFSCVMSGGIDKCADLLKKLVDPKKTEPVSSANKTSWLNTFTNRPLSGIGYFFNIGQRLHLVPEAKAQGFGFQAGDLVLGIWKTSRNICYGLLTLVVVILAFMIMFKVKINPQTVITVQSALPKVIGAIILITFSYAIAGFLIDLMYIVIGLVVAIFTSSATNYTNISWQTLFGDIINKLDIVKLSEIYTNAFASTLTAILHSPQSALNIPLGDAFAWIISMIVYILVLITIILAAITLIRAFVNIILLIIAGPFQILLGTIMNGAGFGAWLKGMMANLAAYPLAVFLYLISLFILAQAVPPAWCPQSTCVFYFTNRINNLTAWSPPMTFGASDAGIQLLFLGISIGIITLIPRVAKLIESFMSGRGYEAGFALTEATRLAMTPVRWGAGFYLDSMRKELAYLESLERSEETAQEIRRLTARINLVSRLGR